jgi:type II secretory pathway component GspD/PulD (secretin)
VATFSADAAVEIISLTYRNPTEVLPLVKSMLSPDGKISADERTNSLIIVDSAEAIAAEVAERFGEAVQGSDGTHRFFVTDTPARFLAVASRFLGRAVETAEHVDV